MNSIGVGPSKLDPGRGSSLSRKMQLELRKVGRQEEKSPCQPRLAGMKYMMCHGVFNETQIVFLVTTYFV